MKRSKGNAPSAAQSRLGRALRTVREAKGLTQGELADQMGMTNVAISYWETDARSPTVESMRRFAEATRVPLCAILILAEPDSDESIASLKKAAMELIARRT